MESKRNESKQGRREKVSKKKAGRNEGRKEVRKKERTLQFRPRPLLCRIPKKCIRDRKPQFWLKPHFSEAQFSLSFTTPLLQHHEHKPCCLHYLLFERGPMQCSTSLQGPQSLPRSSGSVCRAAGEPERVPRP